MDVTAKYRGTLDLITSDFFGQHNYSVFASVVRTYVNILFIVISPIVIYNVRYCYESEEDANGVCTRVHTIAFRLNFGEYAPRNLNRPDAQISFAPNLLLTRFRPHRAAL